MTEEKICNYNANRKYRKIHGYPKGWNPYKYGNPITTYHYPQLSNYEIKQLLKGEN